MADFLGFSIPLGPNLEKTAGDWANSHVILSSFNGTLTDLNALVSQQTTQCQAYVHAQTYGLNSASSEASVCQQVISDRWRDKRAVLEGHQKDVQWSIDKSLMDKLKGIGIGDNSQNMIAILIVIGVVIAIVFLLK